MLIDVNKLNSNSSLSTTKTANLISVHTYEKGLRFSLDRKTINKLCFYIPTALYIIQAVMLLLQFLSPLLQSLFQAFEPPFKRLAQST